MGTSTSWAQLEGKLSRFAVAVGDIPRTKVDEAGRVAKGIIESRTPNRLRNVGKSGAKLSVGLEVNGRGEMASARVFAKGPWQLIERSTRPHLIIPKGARGLGAGRTAKIRNASSLLEVAPRLSGLKIGFGRGAVLKVGDGFAAYAKHPGTRGKHPWADASGPAALAAARVMESSVEAVMRRIF